MTDTAPKRMQVLIRQEMYEQLRLAAFQDRTSMSRIIAYALAEYFERRADQ